MNRHITTKQNVAFELGALHKRNMVAGSSDYGKKFSTSGD